MSTLRANLLPAITATVWTVILSAPPLSGAEYRFTQSSARPIAEAESTLGQSTASDCLGLLESGDPIAAASDEVEQLQYSEDYQLVAPDTAPLADCADSQGVEYCETDACCATEANCCPPRFWIRGEYLMWWTNGSYLPPLVTTSPVGDPIGIIGAPNTEILFGDQRVHNTSRSNYRVKFGYWTDCCEDCGIEAEYFDLGGDPAKFSRLCNGTTALARPFYDVVNDQWASQIICYPGVSVGQVHVDANDHFQSLGVAIRRNLWCWEPCYAVGGGCRDEYYQCGQCGTGCEQYKCDECGGCGDCGGCTGGCAIDPCYRSFRIDWVAGYRHMRLNDHLTVAEHLVVTENVPPIVPGTMYSIVDDFRAINEFHGAELGLITQLRRGRWSLELLAKMAFGNNHQVARVNGSTEVTVPGQATNRYTGGLLALPTNIGHYWRNNFVVVPQFGAEVGFQLNHCVKITGGYNFLYWANVARSGSQIDLGINASQLPPGSLSGEARPAFNLRGADFWAQGFTAGVELSF